MKIDKSYSAINAVGSIIGVLLALSLFVFTEDKVLLGVLFRGVISLLIINNALYPFLTNKPSVLTRKAGKAASKPYSIILLVVGVFALITAIMGYGINGFPLLDWKTIF